MSDSIAARLRDFPDRLPPMLVKELRQGLRARSFVAVFLVLQGLLGIILLTAVSAQSSSQVGSTVSAIIFFFISMALLIFQPLRGVSSLSGEIKANTMEIMSLTRLSAWRITLGKWSAIVSQSALMVAAIIPYLILRYFLGGMQLFAELLMLGMIFVVSAALTAVSVGLSANRALVLRALFPLALVPVGISMIAAALFESSGLTSMVEFFSLSTSESRGIAATVVFFAGYLGWLALDFGASMIAPMAENRATTRRIVGLVLTVVMLPLLRYFPDASYVVAFVFLIPLLVITLAEPIHLTRPLLRSFTRHGLAGRLASWLLYPGWAAGAYYCILVVALFAGAFVYQQGPSADFDEAIISLYGVVGGIIFPAVVLMFFGKRVTNRFAAYLIILASSVVLMGFLAIVAEAMDQEALLYLFVWLPPIAWPLAETLPYASGTSQVAPIAMALGTGYAVLLLGGAAIAHSRTLRSTEPEISSAT
jgi:hypothetical protein